MLVQWGAQLPCPDGGHAALRPPPCFYRGAGARPFVTRAHDRASLTSGITMSPRCRPAGRGLHGYRPAPPRGSTGPAPPPPCADGSAGHCPGVGEARGAPWPAGSAGGAAGGGGTGAEVLVAVAVAMLVAVGVAVAPAGRMAKESQLSVPADGSGSGDGRSRSASLLPQMSKPGPSTTAGGRGGSREPHNSRTLGTPMGTVINRHRRGPSGSQGHVCH